VATRRTIVSDQQDEQRATVQRQRQRQYEIDRITAQYVREFRTGLLPRIEEYVQQYPEYTRELLEFSVYFHTVGFDSPEPDAAPATDLSPAAGRALSQIRERHAGSATSPIEALVKQGGAAGYSPPRLAAAVGLTTDLLAKLEARAIAVATIPPTLIKRLAETLKVAPESVAAYLGASQPGPAGAFYYADRPPTQEQQSFLDAVRASTLPPEQKREWAEIAERERGAGA
jgi:hypothetical protein